MSEQPKLTAEWTVHAQLTITHPDKRVNINVERDVEDNQRNPIKITYNYTTEDLKRDDHGTGTFTKSFIFPASAVDQEKTSDPVDSNIIGSSYTLKNNAKCRSTCSIVLSACTDLFSQQNEEHSKNRTSVNNETSTNNSSPHLLFSNADTTTKTEIISFKDACSQTNKPVKKKEERKLKPYDYRRVTESLLSPDIPRSVYEGHSQSPSNYTCFSRQSTSNNSVTSTDLKKQPRTVHIDVYCTGSEEESASSSSSFNYIAEEDSNSTPQTVYESNQMRLEHIKSGPNDLPRRMVMDPCLRANSLSKENVPNFKESDKKNEINESKRILFNKHIDDQKINRFSNKLHKLDFRKDVSDDAISSNYPNSSYSTVRDLTSSSLSSALTSNSTVFDSVTWKDNYFFPSDNESTSDKEQNTSNSKSQKTEDLSFYPTRDRIYSYEQKEVPDSKQSNLNSMLFLSKNRFDLSQTIIEDEPFEQVRPNNRFEHRITRGGSPFVYDTNSLNRVRKKIISNVDEQNSTSSSSTLRSNLSGYTTEHFFRAKKFGAVVSALRKPGHHVGPVRNPDCQCEHCKRWMVDREQGRGRAYSMSDESLARLKFWSNRNKNNFE